MKNGIITDISIESLYNVIVKYLEDEELKNKVIENLKKNIRKVTILIKLLKLKIA